MADGSLISQATRDKRKHATSTLVTAAIVELVRVAVGNGRSARGRQQPVEGEKPFWKRIEKRARNLHRLSFAWPPRLRLRSILVDEVIVEIFILQPLRLRSPS